MGASRAGCNTRQITVQGFAWTERLQRYVKARQYAKTMEVYHQMQQERICPDISTFLPVLNACAGLRSLEDGKNVHKQIILVGCDSDVYIANCLIDMYSKCGTIEDAWSVFKSIRNRNLVSWNAMIGGYVKSGQCLKAMKLFAEMQEQGVEPNAITFVRVLNACASVACLGEGRRVHEQIIRRSCMSNVYVTTCLVDMYAKCGSIEDAWNVFSKMQQRNVVAWNAMIWGYLRSGLGLKVMQLLRNMELEGVEPDMITFVGALNACASVAALEEGRHVHEQIIQRGFDSDVYVANCLVDMYAKCRSIKDASDVFNRMQKHNLVSWNAMIGGYVKCGQGLQAMELFREMQQEGVEPNAATFVAVLNACTSVAAPQEGRRVHEQIIQRGCLSDMHVATCLVDMYAKCGSIEDASSVFKKMPKHDVVSWNAIIGGYVKSGQGLKAIELFAKMQLDGLEADTVTFVGVLNACASVAALEDGRRVHQQITQRGLDSDLYLANCLVDMYAKCGSIQDASSVFRKMQQHDVVSWNAMVGGFVKTGQGLKAMELFREMKLEGVEPDAITFVGLLNACSSVTALQEGRRVHEEIIRRGYETDVYVANCLIDMYAKCGSVEDGHRVFNKMPTRDVVAWTSMIGGYAMHGDAKKAIRIFKRMGKEGVQIDGITFICLLSACSHGGLVKEGLHYLEFMTSCLNILPTTEHYACMVDLLGRAGWLKEGEEMTQSMPLGNNASVWMSLLGACRLHGNIEMAERAAKRCWELDPENASGSVLLWNIYAAAGKWDKSVAIGEERLERRVLK